MSSGGLWWARKKSRPPAFPLPSPCRHRPVPQRTRARARLARGELATLDPALGDDAVREALPKAWMLP